MQFGGCHPTDGCQFQKTFDGAKFPFLGSNVYFTNGLPALLPFTVKFEDGVPIGVIGATLKDLPSVVTPEAIKGLKFGDEVEAINRTSGWLDRLGVKSQIVLLHQGDNTEGGGPEDDPRAVMSGASELRLRDHHLNLPRPPVAALAEGEPVLWGGVSSHQRRLQWSFSTSRRNRKSRFLTAS